MKVLFIRNSCLLMSHSQVSHGLGIVVTIAHNAGHSVRAIDNNTHYKFYTDKDFSKIITSFKPDVLAYSITIHNAYETYQQVAKFKAAFPNLIIIAGGVHMRHSFEEALRHGVDIVVNREGEKVILPLLEHLEKHGRGEYKKRLDSVAGVSFRKNDGAFHLAKDFPSLDNLDELPIVDYGLFNIRDFIKTKTEAGVFYVTGQRGCPFSCNFCSDEIQRADKRVASADWLFKNVADLYEKYKINYLLIGDNNITVNKNRLVELCNKMIESGLNKKIGISCQTSTRFDIDEEMVCLMKKAGFFRISFGLERLTPYALKKINKEQPLERVHKVFSMVSRHFVNSTIFMMVGFPFETRELLQQEKESFLELTKYSKRLFLSVLCPTPGTIYYDNNPGVKEWYLDKNEYLRLRAYFTNVLDMHTFHTIRKNFFGLSEEVQDSIIDYYLTFKKICYGSFFTRTSIITSMAMKVDFFIANLSRILFAFSPSLEFVVFKRIRPVRYYLGNYLFSRLMTNR